MTEAERAFVQTISERKSTGNGARHRKRGSRSHKCTMPSDTLTPKERAAMNGPITSFSMNAPCTKKVFISLSMDLQKMYIQSIRDKYNASITKLALMLRWDTTNFGKYLTDVLHMNIPYTKPTKSQTEAWDLFLHENNWDTGYYEPYREWPETPSEEAEQENDHARRLSAIEKFNKRYGLAEATADDDTTDADTDDRAIVLIRCHNKIQLEDALDVLEILNTKFNVMIDLKY